MFGRRYLDGAGPGTTRSSSGRCVRGLNAAGWTGYLQYTDGPDWRKESTNGKNRAVQKQNADGGSTSVRNTAGVVLVSVFLW